jgi:hypothetical protein
MAGCKSAKTGNQATLIRQLLLPSNPTSSIQPSKFDLHPLITYPGLTQEMLDYEIQVIRDFVRLKNPVD